MSTRCNIHFTYQGSDHVEANVCRHSDGYPDGDSGVLAGLAKFFEAVQAQCPGDTRFGDPEYLAAKFVIWQARQNAGGRPLAFTGVGVVTGDAADGEYVYTVACRQDGTPEVTWRTP